MAGRGHVEFNGDGQPVRMRGCSLDITWRKQAELEAARHRNELAHLSRVTMLGELSGSLAHELNQPLAAILSNAQAAQQFLKEDVFDVNELRQVLAEIVAEDKRAGEVIRHVRLLFRKGEVGQHFGNLDINEVVQDVLKLMRNDLINQGVTVQTELAENLPAVQGDRVQLQQVLLNLVLNGCEAMIDCDPSERQLLITSGMENGAVHVSVRDRGGSIPEETMERVFEPFFTTKANGMGLGLSVCRTIIEAHRGNICVRNNAEGGATFHFSLPMHVVRRKKISNLNRLMAVSPSPTVFLVDDDAPVRDRALASVARARFAVAAFASPKEFLEHYNPDTPGCLVLDVKMRGNGFGLQRTLREKALLLPIIFLPAMAIFPRVFRR